MKLGIFIHKIFILLILVIVISACSTTKVVPPGEFRLVDNKVIILNSKKYPSFKASDVKPYIRQKPNSYFIGHWNPLLYIYNWENGKDKSWDKFIHKIGAAPTIFNFALLDDSKDNIYTHLKYVGYYNSVVKDSLHASKKKVNVFYKIELGKRYPIHKINYYINDENLDSIYFSNKKKILVKKGAFLSEELLEKESERATKLFRSNGYFDFTKNYFFFSADTSLIPGKAILDVEIRNYTRNGSISEAKPHTQYYYGDVYVQPVSDILRYRVSLNKKGLLKLDTIKYKDITILYDKKLRIRKNVLNNMNQVVPGELYNENVVNKTYQRYTNLNLYNNVNIEMTKKDSSHVDCNIKLIPSKLQGYKLDFEFSTNSAGLLGFSPTIAYYNRNIFKGGEWLNASVMGNFQVSAKDKNVRANEFGANLGLSFPDFLFIPEKNLNIESPRTEVKLGYNYQQRPEFIRNMISVNYGYIWNNLKKHWFFQFYPIQMNIVNMSNESKSFIESLADPFIRNTYKDHFDLGIGTIISYFTDSNPNTQKSNFKAMFSFDLAGNLLSAFNKYMPTDASDFHTIWGSPYSQYVRAEISGTQTFRFGRNDKQSLALRLLCGVGHAYGNSLTMPFERVFWAGGTNSLRGWQSRAVGPGSEPLNTTFSIPNQNGDFRLEANVEYRFPIVWLFYGAVFFDAGNVWLIEKRSDKEKLESSDLNGAYLNKNFLTTTALNTGLGLRLDIKFVVIRFDWGIKLYNPTQTRWLSAGEWFKANGSAFQFGIGYPF